jgi:hypothetical protein
VPEAIRKLCNQDSVNDSESWLNFFP